MPSPTFTGLLALWAEGCTTRTRAWLQTCSKDSDVLTILVNLSWSIPEEDNFVARSALVIDCEKLRTLILRRLDGAERARATVRWYLQSDECSGSIYDNPATREALTKVLEALDG